MTEHKDAPPGAGHNNLEASHGYKETALRFYDLFQERHFQAIQQGSYARDSGLPVIDKKAVQEVATDLFSDFRERVSAYIQQPPSLTGKFREGLARAADDINAEIAALTLPERKMNANRIRILSKLKQVWGKNLMEVTAYIDREEPLSHFPEGPAAAHA